MKKHSRLHVQRLKLKPFDYFMLLGTAVSLVFLLFTFATYTDSAKTRQTELVQTALENMAVNQKKQFDNYIDEKIEILQALAKYPEIYEMEESRQEEFLKEHAEDFGFGNIFVMNTDGVGFYIDEGVHRNQKDEKFFEDIMENEVFVTDPFYTYSATVFITACVSIHNEAGEKVGILCGTIDLTDLRDLIQTNEIILDGECFILNTSGVYMTSDDSRKVVNKVSIYNTKNSELALIRKAIAEKESKKGRITLDGVEYEAILTYLTNYNWIIVQIVPVTNIVALYSFMDDFRILLAFCSALLVFCLSLIIYRWHKSNEKICTDTLTKCNSRAACYDLLEFLEKKSDKAVTIIYMDLNLFKYVNDTYGHEKGDELLCIFCEILENTFGKAGFVGRMGGDEFISVMLDATEDEIKALWTTLEATLKEKNAILNFDYEITAAYGYATRAKGSRDSLETILQHADEKMYEYKAKQKSFR